MNSETGDEGSTRQHLKMILGSRCSKLVIVINKMDSVEWSQDTYNAYILQMTGAIQGLFRAD